MNLQLECGILGELEKCLNTIPVHVNDLDWRRVSGDAPKVEPTCSCNPKPLNGQHWTGCPEGKVGEIARKLHAFLDSPAFKDSGKHPEDCLADFLGSYFPPASQTPELLAELKLLTVKDGKPGVAFERYTKLWGLLPAIINALGATPASTARTDAIQWPQSVPPSEFSMEFVQYMANRMAFSFFRYGHIANAYPDKVNALESLELRLKSYQETRNTEFLVDAANFCMIEFMYPSIEGAEFIADRHDSPGRVCQAGYATVAKNSEIAAPGSVPQAPDNHSDLFFGNLQYSLQTLFAKAGNPFKDLAEWGAVWEALESARKHFGVPQAEPPK